MRLNRAIIAIFILSSSLMAQDAPPEYGTPIDLDSAKKVMTAAERHAKSQKWPVAISIVDNAGFLVMFERLPNTQLGSVEVSIQKAKTAALFRRPTKDFEDRIAEGGVNLKLLKLPGGLPMEGGLPILVDGKVVGGIGVSGVTSSQDAMIARAGLTALKRQQAAQDPMVAPVTGTVTLDGKPLADAELTFLPNLARPSYARTGSNGTFQAVYKDDQKGAHIGNHVVIIRKRDRDSDAETLPMKYNVQTELKVVVREGQNTFDFDLTSH